MYTSVEPPYVERILERDWTTQRILERDWAALLRGGFSPDGKVVATGSFDGSLRLWAPRTGECTTLFMGHPYHDGPVTCLDFHPSTPGLMLTGSEAGGEREKNVNVNVHLSLVRSLIYL